MEKPQTELQEPASIEAPTPATTTPINEKPKRPILKKLLILGLIVIAIPVILSIFAIIFFLYKIFSPTNIAGSDCSKANSQYVAKTYSKVGRRITSCKEFAVQVKPDDYSIQYIEVTSTASTDLCLDVCKTQKSYNVILKDGQPYVNPKIPADVKISGGDPFSGWAESIQPAALNRQTLYEQNCPTDLFNGYPDDKVTGTVSKAYIDLNDLKKEDITSYDGIRAKTDITDAIVTTASGLTCTYSAKVVYGREITFSKFVINQDQPKCATTTKEMSKRYCEFEKALVTSRDYKVCAKFNTVEYAALAYQGDLERAAKDPDAANQICLNYFLRKNPDLAMCDIYTYHENSCKSEINEKLKKN